MSKVGFFDRRIFERFFKLASAITAFISAAVIFKDIPTDSKINCGIALIVVLIILYISLWLRANNLKSIILSVEGSEVNIITGDIFKQDGFKTIAFNDYFDTMVDEKIISSKSLNGVFLKQHLPGSIAALDAHIEHYQFDDGDFLEHDEERKTGKTKKFNIGTLCVYDDYLITAFSKFDKNNQARLTMPEYLEFLIKFWDKVNKVYAQKSVSVPIFGSGITRIKEHKNITDEELLKIMLWTFRISEMRFKHPAKLTIVIHEDKIDQISLLDLKLARNGL
ncbi:macro domain-containing protein [Serratia marcescens]|uniref:macro domain-containing protein n=1 Tax=Serratia marcescens TaxID=615 RepID=UPI0013DC8B12|nr:macro domain-containing protein [Serratia marcescens]